MENDTSLASVDQIRLDQWNDRLAWILVPDTVLLLLYMIFGLLGNAIVIYIYVYRFRQTSDDRFFIPYLAAIDAMACIICGTANLLINFNPVQYTNAISCKVFFMLSQFAGSSSAIMLTIISVQRFQRICRPFKPQMTLKQKKASVLITLSSVFLLSLPCLVTNGITHVRNDSENITGHVCSTVDVMGSNVFPFAYNLLVLAVCVGNLFVLCTLYVMIGQAIYGRVKFRKGSKTAAISESSSSSGLADNPLRKNSAISSVSLRTSSRRMQMAGHRLSLMFLIITVVYVLCFIPTLAVIVWDSLYKNVWLTNVDAGVVAFRFAYTLYIVNNIVNPVIYGFFDNTFRKEIVTWISSTCIAR